MKGVLLRRVCPAGSINGAILTDKGPIVAQENILEGIDGSQVRHCERVAGIVSEGSRVYLASQSGLFLMEDNRIKVLEKTPLIGPVRLLVNGSWVVAVTKQELVIHKAREGLIRYAAYGHQVISVAVAGKKGLIRVLLSVSNGYAVRTLQANKGQLEEISQVAVDSTAYLLTCADEEEWVVIGREGLELVKGDMRRRMTIGSPLVRAAICTGDLLVLSLFGNEICWINRTTATVLKTVRAQCLIERFERTKQGIIGYNRLGDVLLISDQPNDKIKQLRVGLGRVVQMDVATEQGREVLYLVRHTSQGAVVDRVAHERQITNLLPSTLPQADTLSSELKADAQAIRRLAVMHKTMIMQDKEGASLVNAANEVVRIPEALGAVYTKNRVCYVLRNGKVVVGSQTWCLFCHKNCQGCGEELLAARVDGKGGITAGAKGVWVFSWAGEVEYIELSSIVNLELSPRAATVCCTEGVSIIDRSTGQQEAVPLSGRWVAEFHSQYLVNTWAGGLDLVSKTGKVLAKIRTGPVLVKSWSTDGEMAVLNCETCVVFIGPGTASVYTQPGLFALGDSGCFVLDSKVARRCELQPEGFKQTSVVQMQRDIHWAVPVCGGLCVVYTTGPRLSLQGQALPSSGFGVSFCWGGVPLSDLEYLGWSVFGCVRVKSVYVCLGCNSAEGIRVVLLKIDKKEIREVASLLLEGESGLGLVEESSYLIIKTVGRTYTYQIKTGKLVASSFVPAVNVNGSRIKLQVEGKEAVYIDRSKSLSRSIELLSSGWCVLGHELASGGEVSLLEVKSRADWLVTFRLPEGVVQVVKGSPYAISNRPSVFLRLESGAVFLLECLSASELQDLVPVEGRDCVNEDSVFVLSEDPLVENMLWEGNIQIEAPFSLSAMASQLGQDKLPI
ncbi:hypothetical protein NEHOM01_1996 [Nematocida homosporus]|uniref:uncharacterized protein n=1 Tax=Nematocida homosporus TaxID=1912981 RepID=UPI00222031D5|nr:uncharacterized protein NEHOM01_1996 [Nematocida homosporus]KAI5187191.1 hypothetical protein NEHOM01_1996 [Nematocida homosporus]